MIAIVWFAAGCALAAAGSGLARWQKHNRERQRRCDAAQVLRRHGLKVERYIPAIEGGNDNGELLDAMDAFAESGYVIVDRAGEVLGNVCPKRVADHPPRLVVSNQ